METSLARDVQMLSTGVLGAFAVFHLILYLQQPSTRSNLVFSLALVFAAAATFLDFEVGILAGMEQTLLRLQRIASMAWGIMLYVLVVTLFGRTVRWEIALLAVMCPILGVLVFLYPVGLLPLGYAGMTLLVVLMVRHTIAAIRKGQRNARTIALGLTLVLLSMIYDLALDAFWPDQELALSNGYPFGMMAFIVTTSWALGRDTAATQNRLAEEEQARRLSEAELRHHQADIANARRLQQSFLPDCPPENPHLDVCFAQRMAMEVGGDYYDYHELADDSLLLAVGDATGHGTRGGLMVAAVKSLFQTADVTAPPEVILRQASAVLRKMRLQSMFMGLSVVRVEPGSVQLAAAGMPPVLHRHASTAEVDRIVQKTMPLGAFEDFPYERSTFHVEPNDMIVLLSDGLVECFDPDREQLGLDRIAEAVSRQGAGSADELVRALFDLADDWRRGSPWTDDVTLAVVRILGS